MANKDRNDFRSMTSTSILFLMGVLLLGCNVQHRGVTGQATPEKRSVIAPNGVHCTGFMGSKPGYSCYERIARRPGVRCSGYVDPGSNAALPPPPAIYSVRDIGKAGVPRLTPTQLRSVRMIEGAFGSAHLQFVLLPERAELVVFNATRGVCANWAGGYPLLNDNPDGRRFYEPGDNPYTTLTAPD